MLRIIQKIAIVGVLFLSFSVASALTKPSSDADPNSLSYVFYLYYDNGQLFADRDYEIKYDVVSEVFSPESPLAEVAYRGAVLNFKGETVKTFLFDPKGGKSGFTAGKIMVKGPYVGDGLRTQFYDNQGKQSVTVFVSASALCNDDNLCDAAGGESEKNCSNDCKKPRATPTPVVSIQPTSGFFTDFDLNTILIYVVGGVGVVVIAWFGWKWWKKRKEENFMPPPPPPIVPPSSLPPLN